MIKTRVYMDQFGAVVSLSIPEFRAVAKQAIATGCYNVTDGKWLKNAPAPWLDVFHCIDWTTENWQEALDRLDTEGK